MRSCQIALLALLSLAPYTASAMQTGKTAMNETGQRANALGRRFLGAPGQALGGFRSSSWEWRIPDAGLNDSRADSTFDLRLSPPP